MNVNQPSLKTMLEDRYKNKKPNDGKNLKFRNFIC